MIDVSHLSRHFKVAQPGRGLGGKVKRLFAPQHKTIRAVDDVSFQIDEGEIVGYLGPNGAGKSTTVNALVGLITADEGEVKVLGRGWTENPRAIRERIGVQLQETQFSDKLTVAEILCAALQQGAFMKALSGFDGDPKTLELLQHLKLQFVTLDMELTRELQSDSQRLETIREIIRHAGEMQMSTIASDVPTSGDLAMLWRVGVKLVSGDFIQETPRVIGQ